MEWSNAWRIADEVLAKVHYCVLLVLEWTGIVK